MWPFVQSAGNAAGKYAAETSESWTCLGRYGLRPDNCATCASKTRSAKALFELAAGLFGEYQDCKYRNGASCEQIYRAAAERIGVPCALDSK